MSLHSLIQAFRPPQVAPAPTTAPAQAHDNGAARDSMAGCEVDEESWLCEDALFTPDLDAELRLDQADTDRESLGAVMDGMEQLPEASRARIADRIAGLEGYELMVEMERIRRVMDGPNADRALHALAGIDGLVDGHAEAHRIDDAMLDMLVSGVADRRTESDRGSEGILGARRAREATAALLAMDDATYDATRALLDDAGRDADGRTVEGADAGAEQALLLKAVAARADALADPTKREAAMLELKAFGEAIRGTERGELIRRTTVLDIDDANTSTRDPNDLAGGETDTRTDNDGLYQRFEDSCGPTTAQTMHAEIDPVYALSLHERGLHDPSLAHATTEEQRYVLEDVGRGTAIPRATVQAWDSMASTLDGLGADGTVTADQRDSLEKLALGEALEGEDAAAAQSALEAVRAANGGHPTDAELEALAADAGTTGNGMFLHDALNELNDAQFSPQVGGTAAADIDRIEQRAFDGENVGFRIAGPGHTGHFMSVSDVRRQDDGSRELLVTDPWTGATRWVTEADFTSGSAFQDAFGLGEATVQSFDLETP